MTVENTISKTGKQVMGSSTYDFSFDILLKDPTEEAAKKAIKCSVSDGTTETSLVYGKDYSVSLNTNRKGGRVTVVDPKNAGWTIVIYRSYDETQESDYNDFDGFPAETLEQALDKITMILQDLQEQINRSVKVDITGKQTPEELLEEVYTKLDSATEIAAEAIKAAAAATAAANNATEAVESAEQTLAEVTSYVDAAKVDINNTKTAAEAEIDATKNSAIGTINNTVTEANATINQYVDDAEAEVRQIARNEAEAAISDAAEEATATAKTNVNAYVDGTIKPDLQTYVTAAAGSANAAAQSAATAATKQQQAASSAAAAAASQQAAATSADQTAAALAVALELSGYSEIYGGTCGDNTDDEIIGGYIQ